MKTALQILKESVCESDGLFIDKNGDGYIDASNHSVIKAMQAYASQFIDAAAEEAKAYTESRFESVHYCECCPVVDRDSILKLKEQLK